MTTVVNPSVDMEKVEAALVSWAEAVAGISAIFSEDDGAQPDRPYVELEWLRDPTQIGDDYYIDTANTEELILERQLAGVRDAVVTITVYSNSKLPGKAGRNASYFMDLLARSLNMDTIVTEFFEPARMAPWDWADINPGAFIEDGRTVSRRAMDLRIGLAAGGVGEDGIDETVEYITGVTVEAIINTPTDTYESAATASAPTA